MEETELTDQDGKPTGWVSRTLPNPAHGEAMHTCDDKKCPERVEELRLEEIYASSVVIGKTIACSDRPSRASYDAILTLVEHEVSVAVRIILEADVPYARMAALLEEMMYSKFKASAFCSVVFGQKVVEKMRAFCKREGPRDQASVIKQRDLVASVIVGLLIEICEPDEIDMMKVCDHISGTIKMYQQQQRGTS